jgi:hypothetical protein
VKILRRSLAHQCLDALVTCTVLATGCHQPPRPAISAQSLDTAVGEGKVRFIQYKGTGGSQAVMICLDSRGDASFNEGTGAPGPGNNKEKGWESWRNGRRWEWQVEITDGSSIKVWLDGKEYDPSKGNLFLVTLKGGKSEVEQQARDLSAVQPDWNSVKEFAGTDAVVSKFLGVKGD